MRSCARRSMRLRNGTAELTPNRPWRRLLSQMRLAFRSKILTAALGPELVRNYQWSNFDTTLDRIIKDQPAAWLPKEFASYADLLRACYDDAISNLTQEPWRGSSRSGPGVNWRKRVFHIRSAAAPLIGAQFTVPPFPQNGTGGLIGATVNVGAGVSMRLIADPERLGQDATRNRAWRIRIAEESALERSTC